MNLKIHHIEIIKNNNIFDLLFKIKINNSNYNFLDGIKISLNEVNNSKKMSFSEKDLTYFLSFNGLEKEYSIDDLLEKISSLLKEFDYNSILDFYYNSEDIIINNNYLSYELSRLEFASISTFHLIKDNLFINFDIDITSKYANGDLSISAKKKIDDSLYYINFDNRFTFEERIDKTLFFLRNHKERFSFLMDPIIREILEILNEKKRLLI